MSSQSTQRTTGRGVQLRSSLGAVDRARLMVVPRLRSRAPRVPFVTLLSMLLLAGVVGLLLFNTSMQQASFTAAQLEEEASILAAKEQALTTELDQMRNPTRLAERACELGLVAGPPAAFLDVSTSEITGTPVTAVPAPCALAAPPPEPPGGAPAGGHARGNR